MDLLYMQRLADYYYSHLTDEERVVVVCTGYDDLGPPARLISIIVDMYYVLGCKPENNMEIYRDFRYKGECTPMRYGGFYFANGESYEVWTIQL